MYRYEWSLPYLWRWMNWLQRLDVIVLALMLARIVIVVVEVSYRCQLAGRDEGIDTASGAFQRDRRTLVANLNRKVGGLRSIASTAPFLGLAGICIGILSIFRAYSGSVQGFRVMVATYTAAALSTTAAGLLVAFPATWSYNSLRTRIDLLESEISTNLRRSLQFQVAQTLPLAGRFSKVPFAVMAALGLAIFLAVFMIFPTSHSANGLVVGIQRPDRELTKDHSSVMPIVVAVVSTGRDGSIGVYVNAKKTPWNKLDDTIGRELVNRQEAIAYVEAENSVPWADVANVIDIVQGLETKVILTGAPEFHSCHKSIR
ncbi:MAG: hypothetical protein DMG68_20235 [Acidobacteria bacterium]|jgi:biopolymer transport protein ExbB/TolQ/biopolymer transport protein ExbD|nr:MAG: hypothetical protein DMG68_20235 [Acidobacteriota bacterium]